jgi:hypothetical protein
LRGARGGRRGIHDPACGAEAPGNGVDQQRKMRATEHHRIDASVEVREISFIGSEYDDAGERDVSKIYILIAFTARKVRRAADDEPEENLRKLIAKGLHATVSSSGVTGLSKIELNFPRTPIETRPISWRPRHVCIPPAPSMLESFADSAARLMNQLNRMDFVAAWSNVAAVAESSANIAANVDELVDDGKAGIESIVRDMEEAAARVRELATDLRENPSLLIRANDPDPLPETKR